MSERQVQYLLTWDYEGNTFDAVHDSLDVLIDHARAILEGGVTDARMEVLP
jgi:hypothetical protein